MDDPAWGTVAFKLTPERELTLTLDYGALKLIRSRWDIKPPRDHGHVLDEAFNNYDIDRICEFIVITAQRCHPELTVADVMAASPPYDSLILAAAKLNNLFFLGQEAMPVEEAAQEGRPLKRRTTLWNLHSLKHALTGSLRPNSGA
jgi:hypothetical protein